MSDIVQSPAVIRDGKLKKNSHTGDLLHSMKLLEAAASPISKNIYKQKNVNTSVSFLEASNATLNVSRFRDLFSDSQCSTGTRPMISDISTMTINPTDFNQINTPTRYAMDFDNLMYSTADNPGLTVAGGLFGDFKDSLLQHNSSSEVFQLLESYEEICADYCTLLSKIVSQATSEEIEDNCELMKNRFVIGDLFQSVNLSSKLNKPAQELRNLLTKEKQTWQLVAALYRDRLAEAEAEPCTDIDMETKYQSEKMVVDEHFRQNSDIRQAQIVIDWLEQNASEELLSVTEKLQHYYTGRASWENTLYQLKKNSGSEKPLKSNLITEMDPDAPTRLNKSLDELDREDEARFLTAIFSCLRAGKIDEAEDLCTIHGQPWRVAVLEGWRLHHDPNMVTASDDGGLLPLEGNARRKLWKFAAWHCSNNTAYSVSERAIYGALCGNLKAMLDKAQSWEDCLWAYYKTVVDLTIEDVLQRSPHINRPWQYVENISLPDDYYLQRRDLNDVKEIFNKIASTSDKVISAEAKKPHHFIQRCIILNDLEGLLDRMLTGFELESNSEHLLRFYAHLVLLLQTLGAPLDPSKTAAILDAYIKLLIDDDRSGHLVATYAASLPPEMQISSYASFLETITESKLRRKYVELAEEAGLDVRAITKSVVERIRASGDAQGFLTIAETSMSGDPSLDAPITPDDQRKIGAIEWLVFDPWQRAEALIQSNAVIRHFLAQKKHNAARQAMQMIPGDSIKVVRREWFALANKDVPLPASTENAEREHLCLQAFLLAQTAFADWFKHFNKKPRPYEPSNRSTTSTNISMSDMVAEEQKQKAAEDELEKWNQMLQHFCDDAINKIYNVLLFPNGGWLLDSREIEDTEESRCRNRQMELLRRLYIPSLCNVLLKVILDTGGRNEQCIKLANVIADEDGKLYKLFSDSEGQRILLRIQNAIIDIL